MDHDALVLLMKQMLVAIHEARHRRHCGDWPPVALLRWQRHLEAALREGHRARA